MENESNHSKVLLDIFYSKGNLVGIFSNQRFLRVSAGLRTCFTVDGKGSGFLLNLIRLKRAEAP